MSSNPPTRRSRRTSNGEPSLPIIPILIGVIVLGFVIGAGLSLAGRHDLTVVALASPSAAASQTLAPVTPAPSEKPTPEPTPAPAQSPDVPVVATTTRPPPARHATPRAASARATAAPSAAVAVVATTSPHVVRATAVATQAVVARAAVTSDPNAPSNSSDASTTASGGGNASDASSAVQADSAFAKLSAAVVRQYLEAVKRGDQDGAYAALGSTPGAKGVTLTEQGVVDSQTHVGRIDAHAAANDNALVSVQLQTANGPYYGQYTVHKTETGAAVIVAHSIVKP